MLVGVRTLEQFLLTVLGFICGAGGLAVINIIQERWKWKNDRNAALEDRHEEREDEMKELAKRLETFMDRQDEFDQRVKAHFEESDKQIAAQSDALRSMLLDRILYLGRHYVSLGEVDYDDRKRLREMHDCYHNGLGGNGDAKFIMDAVDELPLKNG